MQSTTKSKYEKLANLPTDVADAYRDGYAAAVEIVEARMKCLYEKRLETLERVYESGTRYAELAALRAQLRVREP